MINFEQFTLDNGLRVLVHPDFTVGTAVLNVLYDVGSRDESPEKTGFAHLFEHLMFGGSVNIPDYDKPLQRVGGENNAFTSPDITNYYVTLPAKNLETAFWLESDRMLSLAFNPESLEVQRKVVIEEFKQRYLNPPYGDIWMKIRPLAYKVHPYRWPTIGKEIAHIEDARMEDVRAFFDRFYCPNNAILTVAGPVRTEDVKKLAQKWFGPIAPGNRPARNLQQEPAQTEARLLEHEADVPADQIYKVYKMCGRADKNYHTHDLLSDFLGRGKSARLQKKLVQEERLFNSVNAYVGGAEDPGLLTISGEPAEGVSLEKADRLIEEIVADVHTNLPSEAEFAKVKNQAESTLLFGEIELLNRAMNLSFAALRSRPEDVNSEAEKLAAVSTEDVAREAGKILRPENCSTLYYRAKKL